MTRRTSLEIYPHRGTAYRLFQGQDTRQIDGHTGKPALAEAWYWEPIDYDGDVLDSIASETAGEAMMDAEQAYDNGEWS